MAETVIIGGGTSSVEVNRTAKGEYTWSMKFYFVGNKMREIREILTRVNKARIFLEEMLGQRVTDTEELQENISDLEARLEAAKGAEVAKAKAKK